MEEERQEKLIEKLRDVFESTVDSGFKYDGSLKDIDYVSILCKARESDRMYNVGKFDLCMSNVLYENTESIMILFALQVDTKTGIKYVSEKVMEIVELLESSFVKVDHLDSNEIKGDEEKCIYIVAIKNIEGD